MKIGNGISATLSGRRNIRRMLAGFFCLALFAAAGAQLRKPQAVPNTYGLEIPTTRPRLWWTPERLAQARAWHASNPVTPRDNDHLGKAFRYVMTGEAGYARAAIDYAMSVTVRTSGVASNEARWHGEEVILIYDWCYDRMTPAERSTLVERWNGYLDELRKKDWGGPGMPQSNYFWGYLRNQIEWAVTTWHENPAAAALLEDALVTRWEKSFLPHAAREGAGGVLAEGLQYGRALVDYATVPLVTASLHGRNMFHETNFFREAVYYLIYATPPAPTVLRGNGRAYWETFPFADDQFFQNGGTSQAAAWANFMSAASQVWREEAAGRHARRWLRTIGSRPAPYIAAVDRGGPERPLSTLPLDYYGPGAGFLYAKTSWERDATVIHLQLGHAVDHGAHSHADMGNWQIWRNGRWLSRETTAYAQNITGYNGASAPTNDTVAHNVLLVGGKGFAAAPRNGVSVVKRLESRADYAYGATDLTPAYRNNAVQFARPERDNPAAARVEREFVFARRLDALVIFDRVLSTGAGAAKTFLAHFEQPPQQLAANSWVGVNGKEALRVTTLLPAAPVSRVVNEGGRVGQHRLEVETGGEPQSYFLHVLQARAENDQDLAAQLTESATEYTVSLRHPTRGFARITFAKGATAGKGGFAYSRTAMPTEVSPFLERVQKIEVTARGPVWEGQPDPEAEPPRSQPGRGAERPGAPR